eukprot:TRINITY_DN537_c0_g1_i13.p1 TRINITY_DN537_c0_g1~~TRINITY_DN537_c0_g1_i13.p1  ORF type:complete len:823 (+),score=213.36 TRINITY_DN537_c0_g1_i13:130-2598(+)
MPLKELLMSGSGTTNVVYDPDFEQKETTESKLQFLEKLSTDWNSKTSNWGQLKSRPSFGGSGSSTNSPSSRSIRKKIGRSGSDKRSGSGYLHLAMTGAQGASSGSGSYQPIGFSKPSEKTDKKSKWERFRGVLKNAVSKNPKSSTNHFSTGTFGQSIQSSKKLNPDLLTRWQKEVPCDASRYVEQWVQFDLEPTVSSPLPRGDRISGFLMCKETKSSKWRRRWCVLSGCRMVLFIDENEESAKDVFTIDASTEFIDAQTIRFKQERWLGFGLHQGGKERYFEANCQNDYFRWVEGLVGQLQTCELTPVAIKWHVEDSIVQALNRARLLPQLPTEDQIFNRFSSSSSKDDLKLGSGSFGSVFSGYDSAAGRNVAIKSIAKPKSTDTRMMKVLRNEIECLELVRSLGPHPNIVELVDVIDSTDGAYIIMELANGKDLLQTIEEAEKHDGLQVDSVQRLMARLLRALHFMHGHGMVHRDIKPENIHVTEDFRELKVLDFGFATCWSNKQGHVERTEDGEVLLNTMVGTRYAAAPEIWNKVPYTSSVDIWGAGVVLYMCLMGEMPFSDKGGIGEQMRRVVKARFTKNARWNALPSDAKDLISQMLALDHKKRPTTRQALKHQFFNNQNFRARFPSDASAASLSSSGTESSSKLGAFANRLRRRKSKNKSSKKKKNNENNNNNNNNNNTSPNNNNNNNNNSSNNDNGSPTSHDSVSSPPDMDNISSSGLDADELSATDGTASHSPPPFAISPSPMNDSFSFQSLSPPPALIGMQIGSLDSTTTITSVTVTDTIIDAPSTNASTSAINESAIQKKNSSELKKEEDPVV